MRTYTLVIQSPQGSETRRPLVTIMDAEFFETLRRQGDETLYHDVIQKQVDTMMEEANRYGETWKTWWIERVGA
jgi:hypothetical protein